MDKNFSTFYNYLEKENIQIDKTEFEFQIQSHPNYPSLLAISDTFSFLNIDNLCAKIDYSQIRHLPNRFVVLLKSESDEFQFHLVERENENYFLFENKKKVLISEEQLKKKWEQIVLLLEENSFLDNIKEKKNSYNGILIIITLLLFCGLLYYSSVNFQTSLFFIFPFCGILFSFASLKDLFGVKSKLASDFCAISISASCDSVVNSNKWKIFEILNFSDLSIVFFTSQLIGLFLAILNHDSIDFFFMQKILLLLSLPLVMISLYYQKFVEKKWCPICLAIISIIISELIFIFFVNSFVFNFSLYTLLLFLFLFVLILLLWKRLKRSLIKQKQLKESLFKSIRFERNYENFRNNLLARPQVILPKTPLILGNVESKRVITLISNPFCGHCKKAHEIIESILEKHSEDLQVQIILKTNITLDIDEDSKKLFRGLMEVYEREGVMVFKKALKYWFDKKDTKEWFELFQEGTKLDFDDILTDQYNWCVENDYNFTPAIFINGYEYPKTYDRELLAFFVNDIVEDEL